MNGLQLDNGSIAVGSFDFDGNILQTPTVHYYFNTQTQRVEEFPGYEVDENPEKFFGEDSKYELINGSKEESFVHYRDVSLHSKSRGFRGLISDVELALGANTLAPSISVLKEMFLIKARFISILTARGNSPDNFQRVLQLLNSELLSESDKEEQLSNIANNFGLSGMSEKDLLMYYFGTICDYIPCDNTHIKKFLKLDSKSGAIRKTQAMRWYITEAHRKLREVGEKYGKDIDEIITGESPLAIGFSDDSVGNVVEMGKWMSENLPEYHKGRLYFTGSEERRKDVVMQLKGTGETKVINQGGFEILQIRI